MFYVVREFVFAPDDSRVGGKDRLGQLDSVGYKACGLALLPRNWSPPFLVLSAELYKRWQGTEPLNRASLLDIAVADLEISLDGWIEHWPNGLALRSSATSETLGDRGAYQSVELTADYSSAKICAAITDIYESFAEQQREGAIAIVVQAKVCNIACGHLSNERRVSKTVNQWVWENETLNVGDRFNSQRSSPPTLDDKLTLRSHKPAALTKLLQQIGRWCTSLGVGPVHLEWGVSGVNLWLFQLDVEDDQPESGLDPNAFLRAPDAEPAKAPPAGSPFKVATFQENTGWGKIDKVRTFILERSSPYPQLCYATGADIQAALAVGRDIGQDIRIITNDHAVCRTDCLSEAVEKTNLPRTETVPNTRVVEFMRRTLAALEAKGAKATEVCFILHKFIPARAAAWALADPNKQIVLIDALWGLPDGLSYLSHDTFEYDVRLETLSSEVLRYKSYFLQEVDSGAWELAPVKRNLARHRSISLPNIREIAHTTHSVATKLGRSIQIMWFCGVDDKAKIGASIPWFMEDAPNQPLPAGGQVAPDKNRIIVKTLEQLKNWNFDNCVMELEPEAELFRDEEFLDAVTRVALERNLPVVIRGSMLGHAFYTLQRKGVLVAATEGSRTRTRQRQVFKKLVRDDIPTRIIEKGERVNVARIAKSESRAALVIKLHEEAQELLEASDPESVTAELADLLEVVRSLCLATGIEVGVVEQAADQKRRVRGSFERNVVLLDTSWPSWKERPRGEDGATIALGELGHVENNGDTHIANFASVLGGNQATIVLKDDSRITVKLTGKGLELSESEPVEGSAKQLSFDFKE